MGLTAVALAASVGVPYLIPLRSAWAGYATALAGFAYAVFLIDHLWRLKQAADKRAFLRTHWVEILALLPLGLASGILRWFRLFRAAIMLRRYSEFFHTVFIKHGFLYVCLVTFGLVFAGAFLIDRVEPGIGNFGDALWWSFVTTTTVGYGDIAPKTTDGRLVAVALMLLGIGFISVFTGSVATFFLQRLGAQTTSEDPHIAFLKGRLDALGSMNPAEYREFTGMVDALYRSRREALGTGKADA